MNIEYEGFVDLQNLLLPYGIHKKNPTLRGCFFELEELGKHLKIKTYIKLCCPYSNNLMKKIAESIISNEEIDNIKKMVKEIDISEEEYKELIEKYLKGE